MVKPKWDLFCGELAWAEAVGRGWVRRKRLRDPWGEAEEAARVGLWEAATRFQADVGCAFRSYAYPRILGSILEWAENDGPYRMRARRVFKPRYCSLDADAELAQKLVPASDRPPESATEINDELRALLKFVPDERDRRLLIARFGQSVTEVEAARQAGLNLTQPGASRRIKRSLVAIRTAIGIAPGACAVARVTQPCWRPGMVCACGTKIGFRGDVKGRCARCYKREWARQRAAAAV